MTANARLLLDVTATESSPLKTGIQRVTLELYQWLRQLYEASPGEHRRVIPVYLRLIDGQWQHWQANAFAHRVLASAEQGAGQSAADHPIEAGAPDCLLHLDLAATPVALACKQGLYASYRKRGARVASLVYDLLPLQLPDCFPRAMTQHHHDWLGALATFDGALCISSDVARALKEWLGAHNNLAREPNEHALSVGVFKLGANIGTFSTSSTSSTSDRASQTVSPVHHAYRRPKRFGTQQARTFLMVGTIEPRKGYDAALDAFDALWQDNQDHRLIIVGREGWQHLPLAQRVPVTSLVRRLQQHPERYGRLLWLSSADDQALQSAYAQADCLLAASLGEGFGLPLIEAASRGLPVLARDIAVFREVAPPGTVFFNADQLVDALRHWQPAASPPGPGPAPVSWQDSAMQVSTWLGQTGLFQPAQTSNGH